MKEGISYALFLELAASQSLSLLRTLATADNPRTCKALLGYGIRDKLNMELATKPQTISECARHFWDMEFATWRR